MRRKTALRPLFDRVHLNLQFLRAAEEGDLARMKELHAEGARINAIGRRGRTALFFAALRGDNAMAQWLVAEKISADHPDDDGDTALHVAARGENPDALRAILSAVTVHDAKNGRGETPALLAVLRGTAEMAEDIIRAGADANQRDHDGHPLVILAEAMKAGDKVAVLLSLGANPDLAGGRRGETLALVAARMEDWDRARDLAENGADILSHNAFGDAVLDLARKGAPDDVIIAITERYRPEARKGTEKPLAKRKPISFD